MANKSILAVSIIIPLYNAEKFVGECLDSILAQTFDDYEVIVVDDCSTDNSCKVVESYLPRFNGGVFDRLTLIKLKNNSGSAGIPRNVGIKQAHGEYLLFLDSDDAITETALAEFYPIAKKFDAEVVHCEKHFNAPAATVKLDKNLFKVSAIRPTDFVTAPTLMSANLDERFAIFNAGKFTWSTYTNFVRREFVVENNIEFANFKIGEDFIFTVKLLCFAKNIVLVPNIHYIYRDFQESLTRLNDKTTVNDILERWGALTFNGIVLLDEFLNRIEFFRKRPEYKYGLFDILIGHTLFFPSMYEKFPAYQLDGLVREELSKVEGDTTALTAFLFGRMNIFHLNLIRQSQVIRQQQAQIQQLQAQLQQK